jgi:general secretion pathway protein M
MNALLARFRQLSDREQKLTLLSVVVVIVGMFYWGVWAPLQQGLEQERQRARQQTELLQWVEQTAETAGQLRASAVNGKQFSGSLAQAVNNTAGRHNITIARMQPQDDTLQVWIDDVNFNQLLAWVNTLENQGVIVLQADFTEGSAPGLVSVRRLQLGKS